MGKTTVLVVDDDQALREVVCDSLAEAGFAVTSAGNGREALRVLRTGPVIDLILLDLLMPEMNGWQFRGEQAADPTLHGIPVVVLSGGQGAAETAASMGAAGLVRKPIRLPELLSAVERYARVA